MTEKNKIKNSIWQLGNFLYSHTNLTIYFITTASQALYL